MDPDEEQPEEDLDASDAREKDKLWMRSYNLTEEQITELREVFTMFDTNGLGVIAVHSLGTALRAVGQTPTEAETQDLMQDANLDDEGCLDLDEYMRLIGGRGIKTEEELAEELEDALRVFDKNGEGCVDAEELKNILRTMGEPVDDDDIHELMKVADVAGDGKIDYADFIKKLMVK